MLKIFIKKWKDQWKIPISAVLGNSEHLWCEQNQWNRNTGLSWLKRFFYQQEVAKSIRYYSEATVNFCCCFSWGWLYLKTILFCLPFRLLMHRNHSIHSHFSVTVKIPRKRWLSNLCYRKDLETLSSDPVWDSNMFFGKCLHCRIEMYFLITFDLGFLNRCSMGFQTSLKKEQGVFPKADFGRNIPIYFSIFIFVNDSLASPFIAQDHCILF